jgi:hypothetical protein
MRIRLVALLTAAALSLGAFAPAFAADDDRVQVIFRASYDDEPAKGDDHGKEAESGESEGSGHDVVPVTLWSIAGVLMFGLALSVFYALKRRVGGFPKNPLWKAPISVERSATFADEGTFGDAPAAGHGHH